jgi:hypothetical protein
MSRASSPSSRPLRANQRSKHPAAYLLADAGDLLNRQCRGVEEPDLPVVDGLEQAVDDATVVTDVAVERGALRTTTSVRNGSTSL